MSSEEQDDWTDVRNGCDYDKHGVRKHAGGAYKFVVFALVLAVLSRTLRSRKEYPRNGGRNFLHIALQVAGIVFYARFAVKCRSGTGVLWYIGLLILGSVVINILMVS